MNANFMGGALKLKAAPVLQQPSRNLVPINDKSKKISKKEKKHKKDKKRKKDKSDKKRKHSKDDKKHSRKVDLSDSDEEE